MCGWGGRGSAEKRGGREQIAGLAPRRDKERTTARAGPASPPGERRRSTDHHSQPPPRSDSACLQTGSRDRRQVSRCSCFVGGSSRGDFFRRREESRPLAACRQQRGKQGREGRSARKGESPTQTQPPPSPRDRTVPDPDPCVRFFVLPRASCPESILPLRAPTFGSAPQRDRRSDSHPPLRKRTAPPSGPCVCLFRSGRAREKSARIRNGSAGSCL